MDTSGVSLKECWKDYYILKAIVWHKVWPSNENYGTNCDILDMLIKEISKIAEDVGLDIVDLVGITEV